MTLQVGTIDLTVGKIAVKMTTMYARLLKKPDSSIFLFGPRGTGKSTWIEGLFGSAVIYDFLSKGTRCFR